MKKYIHILILLCTLWYTSAFAHEKLTVLLDWFMNPTHAPLFVADEMGFFKKHGLDVTLIGPADPADPPKLVAANKADIAITYEPQLIQQIDHGLPLIRIGTLIDQPLDCLVALKSSQIQTLFELKNKRIGYSSGATNSVIIKTMLEKSHLSLNDVSLVNVHYGLTQALLTHRVDAVSGVMRNFEIIQLELAKQPVTVFYPEQYGVPTYDELIFVANKKNSHDPRFKAFLLALEEANAYLQQHPAKMWILFKNKHPELNNELNHRAWIASLPYFKKNPFTFDPVEWMRFVNFLQKNGLIKTTLPINQYAINIIKG